MFENGIVWVERGVMFGGEGILLKVNGGIILIVLFIYLVIIKNRVRVYFFFICFIVLWFYIV